MSPPPRCTAAPRRTPPPGSQKYRSILDTAEELFGALGFKKANVDDIAAQAGVSKPLIYRYFSSKEQLFEVVVERVIGDWCDVVTAEGARETAGADARLRNVLAASLEFARTHPVLRGLLARESQLLLQGYSDVLDRGTATLRAVLLTAIEQGVREGSVRGDLDATRVADVLTEVCEAFANRLISGRDGDPDPRLHDAILETVLHGVVTPTSPTVHT